jgi:hypothetical protein
MCQLDDTSITEAQALDDSLHLRKTSKIREQRINRAEWEES